LQSTWSKVLEAAHNFTTAASKLVDPGCGVMAHPSAPNHVRDDPELQAEFPARALPGLCGRLVWSGERLQANR
jgi:hypothetical protein